MPAASPIANQETLSNCHCLPSLHSEMPWAWQLEIFLTGYPQNSESRIGPPPIINCCPSVSIALSPNAYLTACVKWLELDGPIVRTRAWIKESNYQLSIWTVQFRGEVSKVGFLGRIHAPEIWHYDMRIILSRRQSKTQQIQWKVFVFLHLSLPSLKECG